MIGAEDNRRTAGICREGEPIDVTQFTSMPPSGSMLFRNPHARRVYPVHLKLWKPLTTSDLSLVSGEYSLTVHFIGNSCPDTHALVEGIYYMPSQSYNTNYIFPFYREFCL